jgi:hypothetical protein
MTVKELREIALEICIDTSGQMGLQKGHLFADDGEGIFKRFPWHPNTEREIP